MRTDREYPQIQRWYTRDLSPANLYWVSFRLVAAIPLGWVLRYFVAPNLAVEILSSRTYPASISLRRNASRRKILRQSLNSRTLIQSSLQCVRILTTATL